jgi:hypothetical protein
VREEKGGVVEMEEESRVRGEMIIVGTRVREE